eukprot:11177292-Lingulodinium_polyedra.AAC.1
MFGLLNAWRRAGVVRAVAHNVGFPTVQAAPLAASAALVATPAVAFSRRASFGRHPQTPVAAAMFAAVPARVAA